MKRYIGDLIACGYIGLLAVLLVIFLPQFIVATTAHPYLMGAAKFGLLATFGSQLKARRRTGTWQIRPLELVSQFVVWALVGIWITAAFPMFSAGLEGMVLSGFWPSFTVGWLNTIWMALSKSLWINILGGYAFMMMLAHDYLDKVVLRFVGDRMRPLGLLEFGQALDKRVWFGFIPRTIIFFWVPSHIVTFLLPGEWRILFAAALSVALGFFTATPRR